MTRLSIRGGLRLKLLALFLLVALIPSILIGAITLLAEDSGSEQTLCEAANESCLIEAVTAGFWMAPDGELNISSENCETLMALVEPARTLRITVEEEEAASVGYIGSSDGVLVFWPDITEALREVAPFDHRDRPWYQRARDSKETIWTAPYLDASANRPAITCATPIYGDGTLVGVVGMDVSLAELDRDLTLIPSKYAFLVDGVGTVIMRPQTLPEGFQWDELLALGSLLNSSNTELAKTVGNMVGGQSGSATVHLNRGDCNIAYAPLPSVGWSLGIVPGDPELAAAKAAQYDEQFRRIEVQNDIVARSAAENIEIRSDATSSPIFGEEDHQREEGGQSSKAMILAVLLMAVLLGGSVGLWMGRTIVDPIESLAGALEGVGRGDLDAVDSAVLAESSDEIRELGESFAKMMDELRLRTVPDVGLGSETLEEGRLQREGEISGMISEMLMPENPTQAAGYDVSAHSLKTSRKDGHFYDVFEMEDGNAGVVMGEVSGEGISAALLALLSKTLILDSFRIYGDPAKALREANLKVSENARSGMLVTSFCGMLDPLSNMMEYANAGHNPPFVVSSEGFVDTLTGGGMALGALDRIDLEREGWMIDPCDILVMYNDGVTEAEDGAGERFGIERLITLVRDKRERSAKEILDAVERAIEAHIGSLPQADDPFLIIMKRRE